MSHHIEADAVTTQLDLARAYIDMGDPDGSREMLEQVIAAGTPEQQAEAHALMQQAWPQYKAEAITKIAELTIKGAITVEQPDLFK